MLTCYADNNTDQLKSLIEVGVDEAGRGSLIGRVYTGAVIWDKEVTTPLVKDSKKLSKRGRLMAYDFIKENAIAYAYGYAERDEIDEYNILQATMRSMHRTIDALNILPDMILVDGIYFPMYNDTKGYPVSSVMIPKGDSIYYSIAAASIVAKVEHDNHIVQLCKDEPDLEKYDLLNNMGYGSKSHIDAIKQYGISNHHRKSFKLKCIQN